MDAYAHVNVVVDSIDETWETYQRP
jgi:hypothetical protein